MPVKKKKAPKKARKGLFKMSTADAAAVRRKLAEVRAIGAKYRKNKKQTTLFN